MSKKVRFNLNEDIAVEDKCKFLAKKIIKNDTSIKDYVGDTETLSAEQVINTILHKLGLIDDIIPHMTTLYDLVSRFVKVMIVENVGTQREIVIDPILYKSKLSILIKSIDNVNEMLELLGDLDLALKGLHKNWTTVIDHSRANVAPQVKGGAIKKKFLVKDIVGGNGGLLKKEIVTTTKNIGKQYQRSLDIIGSINSQIISSL